MIGVQQDFFRAEDEKQLIAFNQSIPLDIKIKKSIGLLQMWSGRCHGPIAISDSGGKDSDCLIMLAKLAGIDFIAHYSNTTIDPPELVRFLRTERKTTIWHTKPVGLLKRCDVKMPPTRKGKWCCQEYKETSIINAPMRVIGVRAEESPRRANLWREVVVDFIDKTKMILCPILYWTNDDVWNFHELYKLSYCELYDDPYFERLGCIGCPATSCTHRKYEFLKWPRFEQAWHKAVCRNWNLWVNVPRKTPKWREPYDGVSQKIKPEPTDKREIRIIDGKEVEGFWSWKRYHAGFETAEDFWKWWVDIPDEQEDQCQSDVLM